MRRFMPAGLVALMVCGFSGCFVDPKEQIVIRPAENGKPEHRHWKLANPDPTPRDFARINKRHKIILAELDSGVDYNHPKLAENMHFDLDESGKPVGMGRDYLALDDWAHYRAVETNLYPFADRTPEAQDEILKTESPESWDQKVSEELQPIECRMQALESIDGGELGLDKYVHAYRSRASDVDPEYIHGTHVAGLMTYDRPDFGLITYRIIPYYRTKAQKKAENLAQVDVFQKAFEDAIAHAAARGAKIVNMSLGGSMESPSDSTSAQGRKAYAEFLKQKKLFADDMATEMRKYPGVLFVAAAGNDGGFSNNDSRVQAPCGIDAPNLLCVGALNPDGRRTQFTNLPFSKGAVVFAPGYRILSLKPHDTCPELYSVLTGLESGTGGEPLCRFDTLKAEWTANKPALERYKSLFESIAKVCSEEKNYYLRMSGTSMATPLVAHMAAETWIEHPEVTTASDLIPLIKAKFAMPRPSDPEKARGVPTDSLSPAIPSWYGKETFFVTGWDPLSSVRSSVVASPVAKPETVNLKTSSGSSINLKFTPTIGTISSDGGSP